MAVAAEGGWQVGNRDAVEETLGRARALRSLDLGGVQRDTIVERDPVPLEERKARVSSGCSGLTSL